MRLSSFCIAEIFCINPFGFCSNQTSVFYSSFLLFVNGIKAFFFLNKYGYVMLSPSFSPFSPLKRQNMPIFFQAVVFSLNCKIRFYISQSEIFFLFSILHRHWISRTVCFASSIYCKTAANRDFPPAVRRSLFLSLQPKFASFFVHNAVFHRNSRPKNPFLSFVFIQAPLSKGRKKGGRS